jgi:hypothetical protein
MSELSKLVPSIVVPKLRTLQYYAENSDSLVLQADSFRGQSANLAACFERLHQHIVQAANEVIPGKTSEAKKQRVLKL